MGCRYILLLGIVASTMRDSSAAARPQIRFTGLPANQRIVIDYESNGCFHSFKCRFEYSKVPSPQLRVETVDDIYRVGRSADLGVVALLPTDVTRLDNLLHFYRKGINGMCSTRDDIKFTLVEDNRVLATEKYVDESCSGDAASSETGEPLISVAKKDPPALSLSRLYAAAENRPKGIPLSTPIRDSLPRVGEIADVADEADSRSMVTELPGFEAMSHKWRITNCLIGTIAPDGFCVCVWLKSRNRGLVDRVYWENPETNGHPKCTCAQLRQSIRYAEVTAKACRWLRQWKSAESGCSVELLATGKQAVSVLSRDASRMWKQARLAGAPAVVLALSRNGAFSGMVYFSSHEGKALIVEATPAKPGHRVHWLDTISAPVVVDRVGNWRVVNNVKAGGAGGIVPQAAARPTP